MDQEIIYIEDSESFIIGTNILREGNLTTAEAAKLKEKAKKMHMITNIDNHVLNESESDKLLLG